SARCRCCASQDVCDFHTLLLKLMPLASVRAHASANLHSRALAIVHSCLSSILKILALGSGLIPWRRTFPRHNWRFVRCHAVIHDAILNLGGLDRTLHSNLNFAEKWRVANAKNKFSVEAAAGCEFAVKRNRLRLHIRNDLSADNQHPLFERDLLEADF